jgi:hypothetical protein
VLLCHAPTCAGRCPTSAMMASDSVATISRDVSSRRSSVVEASITWEGRGRIGEVSREGKTAACRGVWEEKGCALYLYCLYICFLGFGFRDWYVPVVCARRRACAARG